MLLSHDAIVLRSRKSGESDRLLTLLLDTDEIIDLKYHGIQASQRRSQIATRPGNTTSVVFYRNPRQDSLHSIKEISLQNELIIPADYRWLQRLAALLALFRSSGTDTTGLYVLCSGALAALPECNEIQFQMLVAFLVIRIQKNRGLLAPADQCSHCGKPLFEDKDHQAVVHWAFPDLAFLCARCAMQQGGHPDDTQAQQARWIDRATRNRFARILSAAPSKSPEQPGSTAPMDSFFTVLCRKLLQSYLHDTGPIEEVRFLLDSD